MDRVFKLCHEKSGDNEALVPVKEKGFNSYDL